MTEQEWLASDDVAAMLAFLQAHPVGTAEDPYPGRGPSHWPSDRKQKLWVEACRASGAPANDYVGDLESEAGLRVALGYWSSRDGESRLPMAARAALIRDLAGNPFRPVVLRKECEDCRGTGDETSDGQGHCRACKGTGKRPPAWLTLTVLSLAQAAYDDCRPDGTLDPDRLAILADALEEAGCTSEDLLRHLRGEERCSRCGGKLLTLDADELGRLFNRPMTEEGAAALMAGVQAGLIANRPCPCLTGWRKLPGPHVRGCWALDLVLGKE